MPPCNSTLLILSRIMSESLPPSDPCPSPFAPPPYGTVSACWYIWHLSQTIWDNYLWLSETSIKHNSKFVTCDISLNLSLLTPQCWFVALDKKFFMILLTSFKLFCVEELTLLKITLVIPYWQLAGWVGGFFSKNSVSWFTILPPGSSKTLLSWLRHKKL